MAAVRGKRGGTEPRVVMFSRKTCGLCDKARAVILAERDRTPFAFEEVFIDDDDDLERAHGLRVPVVEIDGVERFETFVDARSFARLMRP
jgi:glutaredoxin